VYPSGLLQLWRRETENSLHGYWRIMRGPGEWKCRDRVRGGFIRELMEGIVLTPIIRVE